MELRDVAALTWKRRWLVLGVLIFCLALSALFVARLAKQYESTASLALTPNTQSQNQIAPDALAALLGTYAETAKSQLLRRTASTALGRPLGGSLETDTVAGTGILRIVARSGNPRAAAENANAVARAFRASIGALGATNNTLVVATVVDPAVPEY